MEKLLDKISSYHILNFILPGIIYCFLCKKFLGITYFDIGIIENIFMYYAIGLVVSRVGSIVINPVLKKIGVIQEAEYSNFIEANKNDPKIEVLVEMNNTYRSFIALFFIFGITAGINQLIKEYPFIESVVGVFAFILVFVLFVLSYRKQTAFIRKRVEKYTKEEVDNN